MRHPFKSLIVRNCPCGVNLLNWGGRPCRKCGKVYCLNCIEAHEEKCEGVKCES